MSILTVFLKSIDSSQIWGINRDFSFYSNHNKVKRQTCFRPCLLFISIYNNTINTVPLKQKTKSFDTTILYINEPDHCVLAKNLTLPGAAVSQDSLSPGPVAVGPAVALTAGSAGSGGADSPGTHHSTYSNITCHIASQYHCIEHLRIGKDNS